MKKAISTSTDNNTTTYKHSEVVDGITTNFEVKEVENGFIVKVCKYGYETKKGKEEYVDEEKVYISKENPLADTPKSLKEQINDALSNLKM